VLTTTSPTPVKQLLTTLSRHSRPRRSRVLNDLAFFGPLLATNKLMLCMR